MYIVDTDSLTLEKPADLDSIFKAFAEDDDGYEEFRDAIKDFYENKWFFHKNTWHTDKYVL